jgi:hypothetical protein
MLHISAGTDASGKGCVTVVLDQGDQFHGTGGALIPGLALDASAAPRAAYLLLYHAEEIETAGTFATGGDAVLPGSRPAKGRRGGN